MRLAASLFTAALVACAQALPKVSRAGRYLYTEDGNRFFIKGIAYQEQGAVVAGDNNDFGEPSSFTDPLASVDACNRDIPYLKQLGVNAIRVYSVDSTLNHDACMQALSGAGIYTIIDLSLPLNGSIDRTTPSWSTNILDLYVATIDAFSKYDNVLAYNVGNEVVRDISTAAAPYVKAAARDIRAYLTSKSSSALVAYAAIDGSTDFRNTLANYLSCDLDGQNGGSTALDLYGLNTYRWCGDDQPSAYDGLNNDYKDFNIPAYFSEFGCVTKPPRLWTETETLFASPMSDIWSGGLAFSYFPATSSDGTYGMVTVSSDGKSVTTSDDFNRLQAEYAKLSPPNSPAKAAAGSTSYPTCPAETATFAASNKIPATPNKAACTCLENILSCQFTPVTSNYSVVLGEVIGNGCSLLGQTGGSCDEIGGNGTTGTYGRLSGCDPTVKASYIMSQYYESQSRNEQACSFAGNGTVNAKAPTPAASAGAAASSCIADPNAIFTPSAPATNGGSGKPSNNPGSGNNNGGGGGNNGAVPLMSAHQAIVGLVGAIGVGMVSAIWTLL